MLVSGSQDSTLKVWNLKSKKITWQFKSCSIINSWSLLFVGVSEVVEEY